MPAVFAEGSNVPVSSCSPHYCVNLLKVKIFTRQFSSFDLKRLTTREWLKARGRIESHMPVKVHDLQ